jgi:hypothetical protein
VISVAYGELGYETTTEPFTSSSLLVVAVSQVVHGNHAYWAGSFNGTGVPLSLALAARN